MGRHRHQRFKIINQSQRLDIPPGPISKEALEFFELLSELEPDIPKIKPLEVYWNQQEGYEIVFSHSLNNSQRNLLARLRRIKESSMKQGNELLTPEMIFNNQQNIDKNKDKPNVPRHLIVALKFNKLPSDIEGVLYPLLGEGLSERFYVYVGK